MMRRMNDGWMVIERNAFSMILVHEVPPPWWRLALELLNPLTWVDSTSTLGQVKRWLHVSIDEDGTLSRYTIGEIPPRWQRPFSWEVPDGDSPRGTSS
ncbi:hypothetical protein DDQ50_04615 [Amnibacterium flavum]|uniref:Uncharacterized protein n=1 Tax=Amnibacterium flavum TaxID=2173173 RepID=A0A2V1HT42_9MICO|nr:hypothetical protein DDQ50_04615 [Amnibacterium flavum]